MIILQIVLGLIIIACLARAGWIIGDMIYDKINK